MLIAECVKLSPEQNESELPVEDTDTQGIDDFFLSFASRRFVRRGSVETGIEFEVDRYLGDDRNVYSI